MSILQQAKVALPLILLSILAALPKEAHAIYQECDWIETTNCRIDSGNVVIDGSCSITMTRYNCRTVYEASDLAFLAGPRNEGKEPRSNDASSGNGNGTPRSQKVSQAIKILTLPKPCSTTAKPVEIPTGEKFLFEADFVLPNDSEDVSVLRTYRKTQDRSGAFGKRWTASFEHTLTFQYVNGDQCIGKLNGGATCSQSSISAIYLIDGASAEKFSSNGAGAWISGKKTLAQVGQIWRLQNSDDSTWEFDSTGRPTSVKNERGIGLTYNYNASNQLVSITHTSGRSISLAWSGDKVVVITAPNGKAYGYGYNTDGYLASVVYPDNLGTRTYHYEDSAQPGGLTGISINGTRYTRYAYQADGKAAWSGLEGGTERSTFTYGADFTNVTNALGQATAYQLATVNGNKRIWRVSRPASGTCAAGARDTQYDTNGNVDYEVDALGVKTDYSYDTDNRLTQKITGIGLNGETDQQQITQYVWDATYKTRLNQIKVFGSNTSQPLSTTTYAYYPDGDPRARLLQSVALTNQGGGTVGTLTTSYNYTIHPNGLIATMTVDGPLSGTGDTVTSTYDTAGNLLTVANSLNHATTYANYNALGQPGSVTSPNGAVVNYTYNARGQVLTEARTVNGITQTTTTVYDDRGRPISVSPRTGLTTSYSYDDFDRLTKVSRRRPQELYPEYAGPIHAPNPSCAGCGPGTPTSPPTIHGKISDISSEGVITGGVCLKAPATGATIAVYLGGPMGYSATPAGQFPATLPATPATTSFCTRFGFPTSLNYSVALTPAMRQQFGGQPIYVYGISSLGNASLKFDGSGNTSLMGGVPPLPAPPSEYARYTYNLLSQITQIKTGLEGTASEVHSIQYIDYDAGGFISQRRGSNGQSLAYHYNANGDVDQVIDALNNTTSYTYDRQRRVSSVTDAGNGVTQIGYNALGLTTLVRDARNNNTAYAYDGLGNLLSQTSPDTGMTTFDYNAQGQRTQLQRADLSTTTDTYDALGRLVTTTSGGQTRTLTYDSCTNGKGMLCSAAKTGGATTTANFAYTPWGQVATRQDVLNGVTDTTAYTYDDLDQLTGISYPSGVSVQYGYTGQHLRVINATVAGVSYRVAAPSYERAFGPATYIEFGRGPGFEGGSRWTQRNFDASDRLAGISTSTYNGLLQSLTYAHDAANRITDITNGVDAARSREFTYDAMSQLISSEPAGAAIEGFGYDAIGNRISRSSNGVQNATLAYPTTSSRLQSLVSGGLTRSFAYNTNGDITAFTNADGVANTLTYDPFGRLASHTKAGVTTSYTVNALDQRMAKSNASNNSRYAYAGFNQLLAEYSNGQWSSYLWLGNEPVALIRNNNIYYLHNDHLGRPESISGFDANNAPTVVWNADNGPFDRTVTQDTIGGLNLGFPGQYYDSESGLWHNGYRDYLADAGGRYLQSDPIGLGGGVNTYAYTSGNPVNAIDPLGLDDVNLILYGAGVTKQMPSRRAPDAFILNGNIGVANLHYALTRNGTVFSGGGGGWDPRHPLKSFGAKPGISLTAVYIDGCPSGEQVDRIIGGGSTSAGVSTGVMSYSRAWSSEGNSNNVGVGVMSPGPTFEQGVSGYVTSLPFGW